MSCFIDKNKIDKYKKALRGKLTAILLEKAKKGESIDIAQEMNSMYEFFKEKGASESLSRDAAAAVPILVSQLISNVQEFADTMKKANPKIRSQVSLIIENLEEDVDSIKNYITLADKKAEVIQKAQAAIKLSKAIAQEEIKAPVEQKLLRDTSFTPVGFSTSGLETKVSRDEKGKVTYSKEADPNVVPYFEVRRKLINLFSESLDDASLDVVYPGIGKVFLKIVSGSTIPKEARAQDQWQQSEAFDQDYVAVIVDEAGNTLFITPAGELAKQGNKVAYLQIANPYTALSRKNLIETEARQILKQTGKELTDKNIQEVKAELELQIDEMIKIRDYISKNPTDNFIMARITGGSKGYKETGVLKLSDIKTLNNQNLSLFKVEVNGKKRDAFKAPDNSSIIHTLSPAKFTTTLADKFAKLFANTIYIGTKTGIRELTFDEKVKLLKQFSFPSQKTLTGIKEAAEKKLDENIFKQAFLNVYQAINGNNLKSNGYTDFLFKESDGKVIIEQQNKSSYYEDFVANRFTETEIVGTLQPNLTFSPIKSEIGKLFPQLAKEEAELIEKSEEEAATATPENIQTEPIVADKNLAQESLDELFKRVGVKAKNKKESGTKIAKGLIWYLGGKGAKEQKAFKDFLETLSESEKKEILAIADATPNAHPMSSKIPFSVIFGAVNSERSGKVASWSTQGIVLYHYFRENGELDGAVSGDFSDIYHEAWHGFTQTFLTEKQRKELYKEASKMPGMFKDYQGNYVTFKDATPLQLEEYLAEDFREYMLSGGKTTKKETPVRNTIFEKILGFLKDLFSNIKVKVSEVVSGKDYSSYPKIREYYENLSVGNLGGYKFDINNRDQTIGELQKTVEARSENDYDLGYEDSQKALNALDSLLSDVVDDANKNAKVEINGVMVSTSALTSTYLKKPKNLKDAYTQIKERLAKEVIPNLKKKFDEAVSDSDKITAQNNLRLAEYMLNNFGDVENLDANKDGKGLIAYHQMKSRYIPYEDRKNFFEDINEEEKSKKGNKIDGKSGNEESQQETADPDVHALLRSLHDYKGNDIQYDELGVKKLVNYDTIWNKLSGLLSGLITEDKILAELKQAAKTDGTINHLLQKLGQGDFVKLSESRLWGKFWQTFNWVNIPLIQVTTKESKSVTTVGDKTITEYFYQLTTGRASAPHQQIGRMWENILRARTETTKYLKKDQNNVTYIDIDALIKDFETQSGTFDLNKKVEFLNALGLTFSEEIKKDKTAEQELQESNIGEPARIFNRLKALSEQNIKRVTSYRDLFREYSIKKDKTAKDLGSIENLFVKLQELEFKYAPYVNNTALVDPNGNVRYEQSLNSTMTIYVDAINNAKSFDELWNLPYMSHFTPGKNTWVGSSIWLNSVFDFANGGKKRPGVALKIDNVAGVKIISDKDEEGDLSAEADEFTKFIQDFHLTLFSGSPELPRHADKTSSYSAHPNKIFRVGQPTATKLYVDNQDFLEGRGEDVAYEEVIFNYISSEFERVKKFREIEQKIKDGETVVFDLEYLKRGREFLVFEKILGEKEIITITKPENKNLSLLEIIQKDDTGLGQRIKDQVQEYFNGLVAENTAKFNKTGKFVSPTYMSALKQASSTKLTDAEIKNALVKSFTYNNWINGVESMIVLYGDIAQYNINKEEFHKRNAGIASTGKIFRWGSRTLSYINSMGNLYARSKKLKEANYIDASGAYNTAVLKDNIVGSKYISDIRDAIESDIRKRLGSSLSEEQIQSATDTAVGDYSDSMEEGNAQGWITFDAYRAFKISIAEWSDNQELMYRKLVAGEALDPKKTLEFFPVMKLQQWGNLENDYAAANAFHKFSLVPLIPSLVKDKKIEALHDKMMNENIAYAVFQTGSKVNTLTKLSYKDDKIVSTPDLFYKNAETREIVTTADPEFTKNTVYLQSLKSQVDVHPEYKGESTFPSQMRKLIENGLVENGVPVTYKPEITDKNERVKAWEAEPDKKKNEEYNQIIKYETSLNNMMEYLKEELIAEADIKFTGEGENKKVVVNQKLLDFLVKELEKSGDLADHEIAVIKLGPNGTLAQDLSISMLSDKIEKALNNIVVRRLVKQKFNGEPLIQVSTAGFEPAVLRGRLTAEEEKLYGGTNDLPFYTREVLERDKNGKPTKYGKTNAAKVKIALQGKFVNLLADDDVLELSSKPEIIAEAKEKLLSPEIVALNKLIKTEEWLNKGDNRKMVTIRGPRIPTQEHNSMEFLEVYEFLDPKAGNIVILPSEIVAKSGGDFDVDKITFLFSNIELVGSKPVFVKANNSIKKSEIVSTKKELKNKLESLYKKRNEIDQKYEDDFDLMKQEKAFNELTAEEQKILTDRKNEFKEAKKEAITALNKLYGLRSDYIKSLKRNYNAEIYDNLQKVEDEIITQNDVISRIDKQSKALTKQYNSVFRSEKVKAFWDSKNEEIAAINSEVDSTKAQLLSISRAAFENDVMDSMDKLLQNSNLYLSLVRPNSVDVLEPIAKSIADKILEKDYNEISYTDKGKSKKRIAGSTIFEYGYNLYKHQSNNIGKKILGIFAVSNTYNSIFNRIGLTLKNEYLYGEKRDIGKTKPTAFIKRVHLALKHNTLKDDKGNDIISLSHLTDANQQYYISNLISQLINGSVDVAKDAWLFLIQGNYEVGPTLEFLIETGVPVEQAIYYVSQPLIREYVDEMQKARSSHARPMGEDVEKKAFARNYAIRKMLDKHFPGLYQEYQIGKNGIPYRRPYNAIQKDIYDETLRLTSTKEFNDFVNGPEAVKNLRDNITSTAITDVDKAVFLHFLEMEEMKDAVKVVKMGTNFDTTKSNSVYEADSKIAIAEDLENVGMLPDNILNSILKNTPIGSFYIQPFQVEIFKDMFTLNNNPVLASYINNIIKDPKTKEFISNNFDKTEDFIRAFKNALPSFILQNELRAFDINQVSYKGTKINTGTGIATIQPVLSLSQGVTVVKKENGERVIYIDRAQLKKDFSNLIKLGGEPQYKNGKIVSVPAKVNPGAFIESPEAFYKFVMERELLRSMYTIEQLSERKDFKDRYKNNLTKEKIKDESDSIFKNRMRVLTYEELLRDMALDNSLNHWKMFKSEESYANQFNKILADYPELSRYSIVKNLTYNERQNNTQKSQKEEKNGSTKNLVFANSFVDTETLNVYHENILELSDPNKIQIAASEVEKKRVAEFFDRMPLFAFMQSGKNSTSSLSIIRAMPQERYIRLMIPAAARFINNINNNTLDKFNKKFVENTKNYQTKNRGENYTIENYNPEKDKSQGPKLPATSEAEPLNLEMDDLGNYTVSLTGKETKKEALATIEANPNAVFIVEDSEKPALNKIGQAAFAEVGKNVLVVKTKPSATTTYTDVTEEQAKEIKVTESNIQEEIPLEIDQKPSITFADGTVIETPFVLNEEQKAALLELEKFAEGIDDPFTTKGKQITIQGYAGTGKTSIIGIFEKYLKEKYFIKPIYSSPTHRANAVTKLKNPKATVYTLHALFGLQGEIKLEDGDYSLQDLEFAAKGKPKIQGGDVLIIDEASMVNDALYEFLETFKDKMGVKLIYMGDPAQLKPVKSKSLSKALTEGQKVYLTKVERTGDNPILEESTNLRNGQDFNYKTKIVGDKGVMYSNSKAFVNKVISDNLKSEAFEKNKLYFRILAATNAKVAEANSTAREIIYGDKASEQLLAGDILMGYNNYDIDYQTKQPKIINSGDYQVKSVERSNKTVNGITYSGFKVELENLLSTESSKTIFIVSNEESNEKLIAFADAISDLNKRGALANQKGNKKEAAELFSRARDLESKLAFMKEVKDSKGNIKIKKTLDYGYAHTIHKSQGGTYNKVLILADTIGAPFDIQSQQQLKYVAVSRASEMVYISTSHTLGEPEIKEAPSALVEQPTAQASTQATTTSETARTIYDKLGNKTQSENVEIPGKGDLADVKYDPKTFWSEVVPEARAQFGDKLIIAYRGKKTNTFLQNYKGRLSGEPALTIGNPFDWQNETGTRDEQGVKSTKRFIHWMITGDNMGVAQATPEYRQAIIDDIKNGKLKNRPIIYYQEKGYATHATALDYLINKYDWSKPSTTIKPGVQELFDSNPKLANQVYGALGFQDIQKLNSYTEFDRISKSNNKELSELAGILKQKDITKRTSILYGILKSGNLGDTSIKYSDDVVSAYVFVDSDVLETDITFLHEELHRYTGAILDIASKYDREQYKNYFSKEELLFIDRVKELHGIYLKNKGKFSTSFNLMEFIAYGLTETNVIKELQEIKVNKSNLFEKIIDTILDLLGIKESNIYDLLKKSFEDFYLADDSNFKLQIKEIIPDEYINQITPQQKQQALRVYSSYLESKGISNVLFHHADTDIDKFDSSSERYFQKELKKKNKYIQKLDDIVFFVKKPLVEEFMSKRKFLGAWGLKTNNILNFSNKTGEKIGEGVHPGIDEGVFEAINGNYDAVDFGRIRDNKTWSEVVAITNPNIVEKLGTKQDIEEFKEWNKTKGVKPGVEELFDSNPELANQVYEALGFKTKADVILPIGTSGSGKSTFIKSLPQENLVVIEPDAMRVEFTGDINNKSKDKEIYEEAAKRAVKAIKQGKQVVFDTTNLTKDKRLPFIEAIKKEIPTANIQYKLMELNPELAKQRIKAQIARGENRANVPDSTIDRHAESYKQMLEDIKSEPISNFETTSQQKQEALQLYSQYLDTIFPDSKVKDIVYHGSNSKFEKFSKEFFGLNTGKTEEKAFYFSKDKKRSASYLTKGLDEIDEAIYYAKLNNDTQDVERLNNLKKDLINIYPVLLNLKNPIIQDKTINQNFSRKDIIEKAKKENFDGVIAKETKDYFVTDQLDKLIYENAPVSDNLIVFEPEQIHILGSKQDIEGFKEFVAKPTQVKPGVDARPQVNPKIKQETDALVEAINELRNQGKDIVYVKGGIGNDLVKSIPGKPAPATQSFIYLSEQLLKANILNPELAKVVNDPQNETSESGKDIIQKVQKDIFGISDDDVSDNLLFCIADL